MSRSIHCVADARRFAKRRMPRIIFDYVDGAAGIEYTNALNSKRLQEIRLQPRVLVNADQRKLTKSFFAKDWGLPFGIAPMGMCNLTWPNADRLLADAAKRFNIPMAQSTMSSSTIEEIASWAAGQGWFQLYVGQSNEQAFELVRRAESAGFDTLILTVDVPQVAPRVRDLRNGFKSPLKIGPKQFLDFAMHPEWSIKSLIAGVPSLANFAPGSFDRDAKRGLADWAFLDQLREKWHGRLIVKGVLSTEDAVRIKSAGVDAIYVSNHGGRQLDSAPAAIDQLPLIRQSVGPDFPLLFDSGIRDGEGVIKALAMGADFVMLGRALLYGLGAGGEAGLSQIIQLISNEISLAMAQLGCSDVAKINQELLIRS